MLAIKVMPNGECTLHQLDGGYTATDVFFGARKVLESRLVSFQFSRGFEFWYDDTGDYFKENQKLRSTNFSSSTHSHTC